MDALALAEFLVESGAHTRGDSVLRASSRACDSRLWTLRRLGSVSPAYAGAPLMLSVKDFDSFFKEVHGHSPFPWQQRLIKTVSSQGKWPPVLDLPTGTGKTATIDVAIFHLALEADRKQARRAPVRIAIVVDRRLIVDDSYGHAKKIAAALKDARPGTVLARVAERLKRLSSDGIPLLVRRLRGGVPREDDWSRTPSQPTVLCSTVDQVGSRLLFRGYGVSDSMKPVHAGLIGSDCLILLDEAHLAEPFRQTLQRIGVYRGKKWRQADYSGAWGVALLTATPGERSDAPFVLNAKDRKHPVLRRRLEAHKIARLIAPTKSKPSGDSDSEGEVIGDCGDEKELDRRVEALLREIRRAFIHFSDESNGAPLPAIGVVVNRVRRARMLFERIEQEFREEIEQGRLARPTLMIGPARPLERDVLAEDLISIRTKVWKEGQNRHLDKARIIVATQCIEAGVDIDLDALVTEAAPLDVLRQRFGRLNRAGRDITSYAAIVASRSDIQTNSNDPVYGKAIQHAWKHLVDAAVVAGRGKDKVSVVDFGLTSCTLQGGPESLSPRADAPVLLPAHVDLLSQTSPIPAADPDISLYLHGTERQSDSITVVWRGDIDSDSEQNDTRRLLKLVPPRAAEAIALPLWAVRRWLDGESRFIPTVLADVAVAEPVSNNRLSRQVRRRVFRWKGDEVQSKWIQPGEIRNGDTIVVPGCYGGVDAFGWNPACETPSVDLGREAALPFIGRRFAIRIAPGLMGNSVTDEALAEALAHAGSRWRDTREAVRRLRLPDEVRRDVCMLDDAVRARVTCYTDLYGMDDEGRPRGVVFLAPFGIKPTTMEEEVGSQSATEDDIAGSMPGFSLSLAKHCADVEDKAAAFGQSCGFPSDRIVDFKIAGFLQDAGKADPRFQAWLHFDDPLGSDTDEPARVLAKSDRPIPSAARLASGLPENWRHEALSVRIALLTRRLSRARDRELVLWLVGTHHGYGRPFFPHVDPLDSQTRSLPFIDGTRIQLPPGHGPQSLAFDWRGADWAALFERLKARYGVWELARMEAAVRLADHRASEEASPKSAERAKRRRS